MKNIIDNIIKNIDIDNVTYATLLGSIDFSIDDLYFSFYCKENILHITYGDSVHDYNSLVKFFLSTTDSDKLKNKFLEKSFIFDVNDEKKVLKELEKLK